MFKKAPKTTNVTSKHLEGFLEDFSAYAAVVLEKVHGVEYQVSYSADGFTFGTGNSQMALKDDIGDAYIRQVIFDRVKLAYQLIKEQTVAQESAAQEAKLAILREHPDKYDHAQAVYESLRPSVSPDFVSVRIRGTLYGGSYPHDEVAQLQNIKKPLRTPHSYAQNVSMATHSIEIDDKPLSWQIVKILCFSVDLPTVPTLYQGNLKGAIEYSKENLQGPTLIPNGQPMLDYKGKVVEPLTALPQIEGNQRHGHVIKLIEPQFLESGDEIVFREINHA